ncbi:uncharacterized protein LOC116304017 [Actinia tenebrosa]|uniref:Uncharacterized protein LOC116304017 n=1 Tax=Actinia tenebrosa TaxID=6105 RepID=A0A6P8IRC7_ACTTE|nr:uncharacterized protein LOC116304017 [Actinia tenebrosa]
MGRLHENVEEQRQKMRPKRKCSEKGKILPCTEDVTHSRSEKTSEMMSQQEVDTVTKRKIKAKELKDSIELHSASLRLKQICFNYASSMNESTPKSQERKTKDQEKMEENQEFTFDFSNRLIALAREKQAENRKRRRSESKTSYRKRKVSGNGGSHDNSGLKRKRQRLSQSQSSWEDFDTTFEKMLNCENELMNETQMKFQSAKRWSTVSNLAPMDFEFSRRLAELSRKNQRYQHEEHAHCCRCVQSFECFWPRSNLQTIRRQGYC